jgi:hypothetical protein
MAVSERTSLRRLIHPSQHRTAVVPGRPVWAHDSEHASPPLPMDHFRHLPVFMGMCEEPSCRHDVQPQACHLVPVHGQAGDMFYKQRRGPTLVPGDVSLAHRSILISQPGAWPHPAPEVQKFKCDGEARDRGPLMPAMVSMPTRRAGLRATPEGPLQSRRVPLPGRSCQTSGAPCSRTACLRLVPPH